MSRKSGLFHRPQARTIMTLPPIEADSPVVLDGAPSSDYSVIIQAREAKITFPLHRLIGKYSEYGRLFAG